MQGGFVGWPREMRDKGWFGNGPPHVRDTFLYLLERACWHNRGDKDKGELLRGEVRITVPQIRTALSWSVGNRVMHYKKSQIETAMRLLRKAEAIAVRKTEWGSVVTILDYETYVPSKTSEARAEARGESERPEGSEARMVVEQQQVQSLREREYGDLETRKEIDGPAFLELIACSQFRAVTLEQWLAIRRDFAGVTGGVKWAEVARMAVKDGELMTEGLSNPALFLKKRVNMWLDSNGKSGIGEKRRVKNYEAAAVPGGGAEWGGVE